MIKDLKVYKITPLILTLGVLFVMLLNGCQAVQSTQGQFVSAKGVNIEALLPADPLVMLKVGTRDASQTANLKLLSSYFPKEMLEQFTKGFKEGFSNGSKMDSTGLDYEKDLLPLINDNSELYFAVEANNKVNSGKVSGDFAVAMTLADTAKFDQLINKQVDSGTLKKEDYNGKIIYSSKESEDNNATFLTRFEDTALLTNSLELSKAAIDANKDNGNALAANQIYKKAIAKSKPGIAFAFINISKLMNYLSSNSDESAKKIQEMIKSTGPQGEQLNAIESETFVINAEKDGLKMNAMVLAKDGADFTKFYPSYPATYLDKKISANNPVFYVESYGLKKAYDGFITSMAMQEKNSFDVNDLKKALSAEGLDLDQDILTFLDKGFAMLYDDSGALTPNLGLFVDASSNPAGALKVLAKLNGMVDKALNDAKKQSPQLGLIVSKQDVVKDKMWKISVNMDMLLTQVPPDVASKLSGQKFELYYGLTADNVMVLALKPDFDKTWGKDSNTVANSKEFVTARNYIQGADKGVGYFSPNQLMLFVDKLINIGKDTRALGTNTEYDQIKGYVMPLKSLIFASGIINKDQVEAQAFLHIGQ